MSPSVFAATVEKQMTEMEEDEKKPRKRMGLGVVIVVKAALL